MTKRIEYIDALRGFAMFIVVFVHMETFGVFRFSYQSGLGQIFISIMLPLFFFISGLVAYKPDFVWNVGNTLSLVGNKLKSQIIPTAIWGSLYTIAFCSSDFKSFVCTPEKFGYWFMVALLEMFLIYYLVRMTAKGWKGDLLLIMVAVLMFILKVPLKSCPSLERFGDITSLHFTCTYFQFFVFGNLASKYKDKFHSVLDNGYVSAIVILLDIALLFVSVSRHSLIESMAYGKYILMLLNIVCGYLGVVIVYNMFRTNEASFSSEKPVGRALQFVGKRTLDVYLLHYFFIPNLSAFASYFRNWNNSVIELVVCSSVAVAVIAVCLLLSNIIRMSPFLSKYLLGVRAK